MQLFDQTFICIIAIYVTFNEGLIEFEEEEK